ncbi:GMC oxidoreductase [Mycena crocata]|nr:GMC oxidoreductase [Mycena crocata]
MFFRAPYPTVEIPRLLDEYDYIIVGGGTAGCVLANRLSRDKDSSVLLIERGGVQDAWASRVPLFSSHFASDGSRSWVSKTVPQKHANNREIELIGGSCLGGSSRINAMLYTRGLPAEFNAWTRSGKWNYEKILPYIVRSEKNLSGTRLAPTSYSGTEGEWSHRAHDHLHWTHSEHMIKATSSLGLPYIEDPNSPFQPAQGCAKLHYSIDSNGHRASTFKAFLPYELAQSRKQRLHICIDTLVRRIELVNNSGTVRAEGVWIQPKRAPTPSRLIRARKEVISCAGPIGSPHLLMLSGIGAAEHLKEHGITVMKDLPGVGSHLQDHLAVPVEFCVPLWDSLSRLSVRPWLILREIFLYIVFGVGLLLAPVLELSIFVQSRLLDDNLHVSTYSKQDMDASNPDNRPDIEVMTIAIANTPLLQGQGGLNLYTVTTRPTSVGTVRLVSSDPAETPAVDPNYLSTASDVALHRKAVRFSVGMKEKMAAQGYPINDWKLTPSLVNSDEALDQYIRESCAGTQHRSSTCRMSPEHDGETGGVVDEDLKVYGVANLRIADSSVFPDIPACHLAAPTVAVAERCSALILENA